MFPSSLSNNKILYACLIETLSSPYFSKKRNWRLVDFIHVNLLAQTRVNKLYIISHLTFHCNLNVKIVFQMEIRGHHLTCTGFKKLFVFLEHYFLTSSFLHMLPFNLHLFLIWVYEYCLDAKTGVQNSYYFLYEICWLFHWNYLSRKVLITIRISPRWKNWVFSSQKYWALSPSNSIIVSMDVFQCIVLRSKSGVYLTNGSPVAFHCLDEILESGVVYNTKELYR